MGHGYAHRWMVQSHLSQRRRILILSVWNEQPFSSDFAEDVVADIIFPSVWPMALSQKVFQCPRGWPTALPLLYGPARSSDFRNIDRVVLDFCEGNDRTGFIEIHTVDYRCARLSRVTGRPFIVLIPVYGLCPGERLSQHTVFSWWFFGATKLAQPIIKGGASCSHNLLEMLKFQVEIGWGCLHSIHDAGRLPFIGKMFLQDS